MNCRIAAVAVLLAGTLLVPFSAPARADAAADTLLKRVAAAMLAVKSASGDVSVSVTGIMGAPAQGQASSVHSSGIFTIMRPNLMREDDWVINPSGQIAGRRPRARHYIAASDGKAYWLIEPDGSMSRGNVDKGGNKLATLSFPSGDDPGPIANMFFDPPMSSTFGQGMVMTVDKNEAWEGKTYRVIHLSSTESPGTPVVMHGEILIGADGLMHRIIMDAGSQGRMDVAIRNLRTAVRLTKADFRFRPPRYAKLVSAQAATPLASTEQVEVPMPSSTQSAPPSVLANGSQAPDFTVYDPQGKPVKLSDYSGKVVVLDFWATWCGPCQMSLPHTNALAKKLAGQNVQFLAVNVWDTKDAFDSWLPAHKQFSSLAFAIDTTPGQGKDIAQTLYHVSGIPTQFVIDPGGKIVQSFVGYDPDTSKLAAAIETAEAKGG